MAYATRSDIEARFGVTNVDRWADLDSDDNAANITARITAAITYGDSTLDSLVRGGVYTVPFTTIPLEIVGAAVELAVWWLYQSRPRSNNESDKGFDKMHEDTVEFLAKVKRGAVRLDLTHTEMAPLIAKDPA